jgi:hypothetical protein
MKISAYFFDKYTNESIPIALVLWPLYFIPFYLFYRNTEDILNRSILFPLIGSLILASFSALIFSDTLIEYLVFFFGFGILLFGSIAKVNPNKKSLGIFLFGILTSLLAGSIVYAMRTRIYKRNSIPDTKGIINFTEKSYWLWILIQTIIYIYVLSYMFNHNI